jgi:hypothetical protein
MMFETRLANTLGNWFKLIHIFLACLMLAPLAGLHAQTLSVVVNGSASFDTPAGVANVTTVDWDSTLLSSKSALVTNTGAAIGSSATVQPYMSGNHGRIASGKGSCFLFACGTASATGNLNFTSGGTTYVSFLWGIPDNQNSAHVKIYLNGSTTASVTLKNCSTASDPTCVGYYTPSNIFTSLFTLLLGSGQPNYGTVYVSYLPPAGSKVTKVEFWIQDYTNCVLLALCAKYDQYVYLDNLRFVDQSVEPHHLTLTTASTTVAKGTAVPFTISACGDSSSPCTATKAYTSGVTGNLSVANVSGTLTPSYTTGQPVAISSGASSSTEQITFTGPSPGVGVGTARIGMTGQSPAPTVGAAVVYCGFGGATPASTTTTPSACDLKVVDLDHLQITTDTSGDLLNTNVTYTITACANAPCTETYPGAVSGTLAIAGPSVTWVSGPAFTISSGTGSTTVIAKVTTSAVATVSATGVSPTAVSAVKCGLVGAAASSTCTFTPSAPLHHIAITAPANTGMTCTPLVYTVTACGDANCTVAGRYTRGVTGKLNVAVGSTNFPSGGAGTSFTIDAGSSQTTVTSNVTSVGTATASILSSTPTATSTTTCKMTGTDPLNVITGGAACNIDMKESGLIYTVPSHVSATTQTFNVSAVRKDTSGACAPAATGTRNVAFTCKYMNPGSGTAAVVVNGTNVACAPSSGAPTPVNVSLNFNASGVAAATVVYADVGNVQLDTSYSGSAATSDTGLSMTGSNTFTAAPYRFTVDSITQNTGAAIQAGQAFKVTLTAKNAAGNTTANYGLESPTQAPTLTLVRVGPAVASAASGVFSGSIASYASGTATGTNLTWSEVGVIDIAAQVSDYLSSGLAVVGSRDGAVACAVDGGSCTIPTGALATVYYGYESGASPYVVTRAVRTNQAGAVPCTNGYFGVPADGLAKSCKYVVTGGYAAAGAGAHPTVYPDHYDVAIGTNTAGCGGFTYSGQPFGLVVTAKNASNNTTANYDGSLGNGYTPSGVIVSAGSNGSVGSFTSASIGASAFTAGATQNIAPTSGSLAFKFTTDSTHKQTAPTAVKMHVTDAVVSSITSVSAAEPSMTFRSGRLKVSNAFGSEKINLQLGVQAQYWTGKAWALNNADSCTAVPVASVALANYNYITANGTSGTAWTTSPTVAATVGGVNMAVKLASGIGTLTLNAPNKAGSVDFAFNLGASGGTDKSCLVQGSGYPSTTPAGLPWLRSGFGTANGCASSGINSDPSARATFGVFSPETRKAVFVRDVY